MGAALTPAPLPVTVGNTMEVQTTVWLELVASALTVFLMPFAAGACVEVYLLPERGSVSRAVGLLACLIVTAGAWWVL